MARGGEAASVGQKLLEYTEQLFTWWHRSAMAPCNCRASRFTSVAICASGFVSNSGMGSSSPTPRRPQPAQSARHRAGPVDLRAPRTATSSPRTTRPSAAFAWESCGALPASAPTAPTEAASSNGCLPCVTRCADGAPRLDYLTTACYAALTSQLFRFYPKTPQCRGKPTGFLSLLAASPRDLNGY